MRVRAAGPTEAGRAAPGDRAAASPGDLWTGARGRGARIRRPVAAPSAIDRPELRALLDDGVTARRLTLLIAGAGFGKTTLLSQVQPGMPLAWYAVEAGDADAGVLAAGIAAAVEAAVAEFESDLAEVEQAAAPTSDAEIEERAIGSAALLVDAIDELPEGLVLVLDDLHLLGSGASAWRMIDTLVRIAPPAVHVVLSSRTEPPFAIERLRGQGEVLDLGEQSLAFGVPEVDRVLDAVLARDPLTPDERNRTAREVHGMTAGWPAAVRLAAEALRVAGPAGRAAALDRLRAPGGPIFAYLAEEVVAHASAAVSELVRRMSHFDRFSVDLCVALGLEDAERVLDGLARRALFIQPISGSAGWYELHGLLREYAMNRMPLEPAQAAELFGRAAAWYEQTGQLEAALGALLRASEPGLLRAFLGRHGAALVAGGAARLVLQGVGELPDSLRDPEIELLLGEAGLSLGEWPVAIAALRRAGGDGAQLSAAVAWRLGVIQGLRGAYDQALAIYTRAVLDGAAPEDEAFLWAFTASAQHHRGDAEATGEAARRALAAAERSGAPRVLAAAHAAVAQAREDANQLAEAGEAYRLALAAAEAAGDVVQRVRILTALGSLDIEVGRFADGLAALDQAVDLAQAIGFAAFQARALAERGRAKWWQGQAEEALDDMVAGRELYNRLDSPGRVWALLDEGELHLFRGDIVAARGLLESAVRAGRESNDKLLGLCLAELSEAIAPDDPERSIRLLDEALALGRRIRNAATLVAVAYSYLELRDEERAGAIGREAESIAQETGELPKIALAREVQGRVAHDPAVARRLIGSAAEIWRQLDSPLGLALNRLDLALATDGPEAREAAAEAEQSLRALGARHIADNAGRRLAELDAAERPPVSIRTLGGFALLRDGEPVPSGEWRSKKARDLLKILAARRGRPVPREQLFELLWPDDDPEPLANRLSVALTTVRTTLDPGHRFASDHFVGADRTSVWLELEHVDVDLVSFLADVANGRRLQRGGRGVEALARFERAEAAYRGEFLEEDPYEDYATAVREEAQSAYMDAAREVARHAESGDDPDTAIRIQLRILELDAFDERAHVGLIRALIAAGRHGEARRRYAVFAARMAEIGVEAEPFPSAPGQVRPGR